MELHNQEHYLRYSRYIKKENTLEYIDFVTEGNWTLSDLEENKFQWVSSHGGMKEYSDIYPTHNKALISMINDIVFFQNQFCMGGFPEVIN